jgi:hypothetical protein
MSDPQGAPARTPVSKRYGELRVPGSVLPATRPIDELRVEVAGSHGYPEWSQLSDDEKLDELARRDGHPRTLLGGWKRRLPSGPPELAGPCYVRDIS